MEYSLPSYAADLRPSLDTAPKPVAPVPVVNDGWIITLSAQGYAAHEFPGADHYRIFPAPGIDFRRANEPEHFSAPDDSFSIPLFESAVFRAGPVGRYIGKRKISDQPNLIGLRNVSDTIEVGGFAEVNPREWLRGRVEVRYGVDGHQGFVATLAGDIWKQWGRWTAAIGPRLNFGDDHYTRTYFSVTPSQAAYNVAHGGFLTPYRANGGLNSAGLAASARYALTPAWRTTVFGGYQRLVGSAGDSPIARIGTARDNFSGGLELAYQFALSDALGVFHK